MSDPDIPDQHPVEVVAVCPECGSRLGEVILSEDGKILHDLISIYSDVQWDVDRDRQLSLLPFGHRETCSKRVKESTGE